MLNLLIMILCFMVPFLPLEEIFPFLSSMSWVHWIAIGLVYGWIYSIVKSSKSEESSGSSI